MGTKRTQRPRYKKEEVLRAIEGSGGIVSVVAKRLGCHWNTARRYIDRWRETREAFSAETEVVLDMAEAVVVHEIKRNNVRVAQWLLTRKGSRRGYSNTLALQTDGEPLRVVLKWDGGSGDDADA